MLKFVKHHNDVDFKKSIVIVGFPGMGLVGKTVAMHLIDSLDAKLFASIYGTSFPAQLIVNSGGVADINRVSIYTSRVGDLGIFIVTGDSQPITDSEQHMLSYYILNKLRKYGLSEIIAAAAFVSDVVVTNRRVFVVGNSENVTRKYIERGAVALNEGVISGLNGIVVGWAKVFGIDGICVLGETWRSIVELNYIDYTAAKLIIDLLNGVWGLGVDSRDLEIRGRGVEKEIELMLKSFAQQKEEGGKAGEKRPYYIT